MTNAHTAVWVVERGVTSNQPWHPVSVGWPLRARDIDLAAASPNAYIAIASELLFVQESTYVHQAYHQVMRECVSLQGASPSDSVRPVRQHRASHRHKCFYLENCSLQGLAQAPDMGSQRCGPPAIHIERWKLLKTRDKDVERGLEVPSPRTARGVWSRTGDLGVSSPYPRQQDNNLLTGLLISA